MLSKSISIYLDRLLRNLPEIESIWLIGSRANNTSEEGSDWDFIVFGGDNIRVKLEASPDLYNIETDILVVNLDGDFKSVYGKEKTGSLSKWEWRLLSDKVAEYKGVKAIDFDLDGDGFTGVTSPFETMTCKAYKVR